MKNRKGNRMKGYDYSMNNTYFVTNCVKNRLCCLGSVGTGRDLSVVGGAIDIDLSIGGNGLEKRMYLNKYGNIVQDCIFWLSEQYPYVIIHNQIVMPNHFHILLEIDSSLVKKDVVKIKSLSSLIGALKTTSSKKIREAGFEDFAWHRSFHDHIVRNEQSYTTILHYISINPERWCEDSFFEID